MLQRGHVLVVVSGYATAGPFAYSIAKPNSVAPATIITIAAGQGNKLTNQLDFVSLSMFILYLLYL